MLEVIVIPEVSRIHVEFHFAGILHIRLSKSRCYKKY